MSNVTFYLLDETDDTHQQPAHFALACLLATRSYRNKQKCLVYCQDQSQAEQFDELLWQLPNDAFVPHNLAGEGPVGGAPVEICWQTPRACFFSCLNLRISKSHFTQDGYLFQTKV